MHAESCYSADGIGETAGTEQVHQGVHALWLVDVEVPELEDQLHREDGYFNSRTYHSWIHPVGGRMLLVASVQGREPDRVTDEEHWLGGD